MNRPLWLCVCVLSVCVCVVSMHSWLNRRVEERRKLDAADGRQPIVEFYRDECNSEPHGKRLSEWHAEAGNYDLLERHHSFIQWLFPTRTPSMVNGAVAPLSDADVAALKSDVEVGKRLIKSYRVMLEFYGMVLVNEATGEVARSPDYKDRYYWTLERSWHNHLRVCRILSCFSALGFRRYKVPLVQHLEREMGYAPGQSASAPRAISLPVRVINMFRTYIREDTRDYLKYSGVKLPGDHTDHVYLQQIDAALDADTEPEPDTEDEGEGGEGEAAGTGGGAGAGAGAGVGASVASNAPTEAPVEAPEAAAAAAPAVEAAPTPPPAVPADMSDLPPPPQVTRQSTLCADELCEDETAVADEDETAVVDEDGDSNLG